MNYRLIKLFLLNGLVIGAFLHPQWVTANDRPTPKPIFTQYTDNLPAITEPASFGADFMTFQVTVTTPAGGPCASNSSFSGSYVGLINTILNTVTVYVPFGCDRSQVQLQFSVSPDASVVPSAISISDFTNPITFTITSQDGLTIKTYTATCLEIPASGLNDLLSFSLPGSNSILIDHNLHQIIAIYDPSLDPGTFIPQWTISPRARMFDKFLGTEICSGQTPLNAMGSWSSTLPAASFFIAAENFDSNNPVYHVYTLFLKPAINDCENVIPALIGDNTGYQGPTLYSYTAPVPQQLTISSCHPDNKQDFVNGYSYDTYLLVYTKCDGTGTLIAYNDDLETACGINRASSAVTINLAPCQTIYIHWPLNYPTAAHSADIFHFTLTATDTDPLYSPLTLTLNGTSPVASGSPSTITSTVAGGTPPYNFLWSTLETAPSITTMPLLTTLYALTVTDATGCTATEAFNVEVTNSLAVTTTPVTDVGCTTALGGGEVTTGGGLTVTARGICWATHTYPDLSDNYTTDGTGTGIFISHLTDLLHNTTYHIRAYATNSLGTVYGADLTFTNLMCDGTFTDPRDSHIYGYKKIGDQYWMCENLAYLPSVSNSGYGSDSSPFFYVYNYSGTNPAVAMNHPNYKIYGVLYNWAAAMDGSGSNNDDPGNVQGICPPGWHLPSDKEWYVLTNYIGEYAGGQMKETGTIHWLSPNMGATNTNGFTALPAGGRTSSGFFMGMGTSTSFLSSRLDNTLQPWGRNLMFSHEEAHPVLLSLSVGYSVRCVTRTIGVNYANLLNNVRIYPNPATNTINLSIDSPEIQDFIIQIITITGTEIYRTEIKSVNYFIHKIDINGYDKGIYFILINSGKEKIARKIIIQ